MEIHISENQINISEGESLLTIDEDITDIKVISTNEYNVRSINSISDRYPHLRQQSKAP